MKNLKYLAIGLFAFAIVGVSSVSATNATNVEYTGSNVTSELKEGVYYVTLTGNADEDFQVLDGQTVVLDLNGFELTNYTKAVEAIKVFKGGHLTIIDSSEEGTGTVTHLEGSTYGPITNQGTLIIEGGSYKIDDNFYIVRNEADLTINGGTFTSTSGTSMIGNIVSEERELEGVTPTAVIEDGTFEAQGVVLINRADSEMTINGGTFTSKTSYVLDNTGDAVIAGGTLTSETTSAIFLNETYAGESISLAVNGGNIVSSETAQSDIMLQTGSVGATVTAPVTQSSDLVTITGGTFSNDVSGLLGDGYEVGEDGSVVEKEEPTTPPEEETPTTPSEDDTTTPEEVPEVPQTYDGVVVSAVVGAGALAVVVAAIVLAKKRILFN